MYLELSPRQVGKTTRLVKAITEHLSARPDNYACITVHTMAWGKDLVRMIDRSLHERISYSSTFKHHDRHLLGYTDPFGDRVKYFFDEFDFCGVENVPVIKDGYYCTTAKFYRKVKDWENWGADPLLRLLVANDFMYTVAHGMKPFFDHPPSKLDDAKRNMGKDAFELEYSNRFDDMWGSGHKKSFREMGE